MSGLVLRFETLTSHVVHAVSRRERPGWKSEPWYLRRYQWHQARNFHVGTAKAQQPSTDLEAVLSAPRKVSWKPILDASTSTVSRNRPLLVALRKGNPDKALQIVIEYSEDVSLLGSIPATAFTELLRLLRPDSFIEPDKSPYGQRASREGQALKLRCVQGSIEAFLNIARRVAQFRRQLGTPLTLTDYTLLLDSARALGDSMSVVTLWEELRLDGVKPDTTCYNHYMEARCWSGLFDPVQREKMRVQNYLAWRVTRSVEEVGQLGLEGKLTMRQVMDLHDEMVEEGVPADEKTYTLVMTGMARGGDTQSIKYVLKHVWNIDVDKYLELDEEALEPVTTYPRGSLLQPSVDLLYALAHGFGINSDLPTALRLVDYVSRCYKIKVPIEVWDELLTWSFILSMPRGAHAPADKSSEGQLPLESVEQLWMTMIAPPYNIKPSQAMYDKYIRNLYFRRKYGQALQVMKTRYIPYRILARAFKHAERRYFLARTLQEREVTVPIPELSVERLGREVEFLRLVRLRNHSFIRRWFVWMLRISFLIKERDLRWERRLLATEMARWHVFFPKTATYQTSGGTVQIRDGLSGRHWEALGSKGGHRASEPAGVRKSIRHVFVTRRSFRYIFGKRKAR